MTMFYYEEKNAFGRFSPRIAHDDRPSAKSAAGGKREIRNVHQIPQEMELMDLHDLEKHFNQPQAAPAPAPEPQPGNSTDDFIDLAISRGATILWREHEVEQISFTPEKLAKFAQHLLNPESFLTMLADEVHRDNVKAGWWTDLNTGEDLHGKRNVPEMLALIHSEISEGLEGYRKKLMDDKLPQHPMLKVELIDAVIRILDLLGSEGNADHPAGLIFQQKRAYNAQRADHKPENRLAAGGKAF